MPIESGALDSIIGEGLAKSPYQLAMERIKELEEKVRSLEEQMEYEADYDTYR